eukprot:4717288-Pyramimonas_sp.AAC.1
MRARSFWDATLMVLTLWSTFWCVAAQDEAHPAQASPAQIYKEPAPGVGGRSWGGHSDRAPNNKDLMHANSGLLRALTGRPFKRRATTNRINPSAKNNTTSYTSGYGVRNRINPI